MPDPALIARVRRMFLGMGVGETRPWSDEAMRAMTRAFELIAREAGRADDPGAVMEYLERWMAEAKGVQGQQG